MWYEHGYSLIYFSSISFAQNQIWFWKWSDPKKKKDFGNKLTIYISIKIKRNPTSWERERESQHFFFVCVVISCFGDSYPFYSQDYIIIFSGLFSYFYYYNTNEKSFLEKLLGSLVIFFGVEKGNLFINIKKHYYIILVHMALSWSSYIKMSYTWLLYTKGGHWSYSSMLHCYSLSLFPSFRTHSSLQSLHDIRDLERWSILQRTRSCNNISKLQFLVPSQSMLLSN